MSNHLSSTLATLGHKCAYCGGTPEALDHVIPRADLAGLTDEELGYVGLTGPDDPANLKPACNSCNASKRDMELRAWLAKCVLGGVICPIIPPTAVAIRVRNAIRSGAAAEWVVAEARVAVEALRQDLGFELEMWSL